MTNFFTPLHVKIYHGCICLVSERLDVTIITTLPLNERKTKSKHFKEKLFNFMACCVTIQIQIHNVQFL
jgi:hypothetical protein